MYIYKHSVVYISHIHMRYSSKGSGFSPLPHPNSLLIIDFLYIITLKIFCLLSQEDKQPEVGGTCTQCTRTVHVWIGTDGIKE